MPAQTSRAKRPVLLIVGCGDVGLRVLRLVLPRWRVLALTSSPARVPGLRAAGATPLLGNLYDARTLSRLAGLADAVLHLAPPPSDSPIQSDAHAGCVQRQRDALPGDALDQRAGWRVAGLH